MALRHAFTVAEWHRMGETGLFGEDARLELLDGEVIEMSPVGSAHASCVMALNSLLVAAVGDRAIISPQNPVTLDDRSEPQPDVAVLRRRPDRYWESHPSPEDILLLIEVSDSTLTFDRDQKALLYARAGVSETWVVDPTGSQIFVMRSPHPDGYHSIRVVGRSGEVNIEALDGVVLHADNMMGPG
jgi:Uma2 family endonuclease